MQGLCKKLPMQLKQLNWPCRICLREPDAFAQAPEPFTDDFQGCVTSSSVSSIPGNRERINDIFTYRRNFLTRRRRRKLRRSAADFAEIVQWGFGTNLPNKRKEDPLCPACYFLLRSPWRRIKSRSLSEKVIENFRNVW